MVDAVPGIQRSLLSPASPSRAAAATVRAQPRDAGRIAVVAPVVEDATEACWRAALIARDHRLRLHLAAVGSADSDACAEAALQRTATDIRSHLALDVQVELARSSLSAAAQRRRCSSCVPLGCSRAIRAWWWRMPWRAAKRT